MEESTSQPKPRKPKTRKPYLNHILETATENKAEDTENPKQFPNSGKASYYKIFLSKQKKDGGRKMSKKSKEELIFKNHSGV